jgi:hypothetical protein
MAIMSIEKKDRTTRRVFVKEIAGAAVVGALVGLETISTPSLCAGRTLIFPEQNAADSASTKTAEGKGELLVAPCGLYCGACPMYLATQDKDGERFKALMKQFSGGNMQFKQEDLLCDGCIANGRVATFCRKCAIRACAEEKSNVARCSDCSDSPCARITGFNNDGMTHHAEVLANLRQIRAMGMKEWTKHEEDRWRCPQCRTAISWYDAACPKCGAMRSDRLFPLKKI